MRSDRTRPGGLFARSLLIGAIWCALGAAFGQETPPAASVGEEPGYTMPRESLPGGESETDEAADEESSQDTQNEAQENAGDSCGALMRLFDDASGRSWLRDAGLKLSGFFNAGMIWNAQSPSNNINGPVGFPDRANTAQMDQLYLIFERPLDTDADQWQLGGRVDLLYGTDYLYTQAAGLELDDSFDSRWNGHSTMNRSNGTQAQWYGLAMPQLYAEVAGRGLSVKMGHFLSIIGYETVPATGNFFYTHTYSMIYSPFTNTGLMAAYKLSDRLTFTNGFVQGWDNFDNTNPGLSYIGGLLWTDADQLVTLNATALVGQEPTLPAATVGPIFAQGAPVSAHAYRWLYNVIGTFVLTERLTYVIQWYDAAQGEAFGPGTQNAEWYALSQYLFYQWSDHLKGGIRGEWFHDDDGFRITNGAGSYNDLSLGLNWNPRGNKCLLVRPEVRWDWTTDGVRAFGGFAPGTRQFTDSSQFLFAADVIWRF